MQIQTIEKTEKTLHTCANCGHTGDNLVGNYYWIGGTVKVIKCIMNNKRIFRGYNEDSS